MLLASFLIAISVGAQPALAPQSQSRALPVTMTSCANPRVQQVRKPGAGLRAQRLDELPPGDLELSVLRNIDGCAEPAILREGLGR